jgi:hypothetical protein
MLTGQKYAVCTAQGQAVSYYAALMSYCCCNCVQCMQYTLCRKHAQNGDQTASSSSSSSSGDGLAGGDRRGDHHNTDASSQQAGTLHIYMYTYLFLEKIAEIKQQSYVALVQVSVSLRALAGAVISKLLNRSSKRL